MSLSAMEAAFEGFRITSARPVSVLIWTIGFFISAVLCTLAMEALAGDAMRNYLAVVEGGGQPTPDQVVAFFGAMGPAYLALIAISLPIQAVLINGVMRASVAETGDRLGYLRLGGRELAQMGNLFLWALILFFTYIAAALVSLIPAFIVGLVGGFISPVLGSALGALAVVAFIFVALLLVSARLSLAGPITALEGGIGLSRSWTATKGLSWKLAGALFVASVFALIVVILVGLIALGVLSAMTGGLTQAWAFVSTAGTAGPLLITPTGVVYMAFSALINGLTTVIGFGVGADAWRQLRGGRTSVPETFA